LKEERWVSGGSRKALPHPDNDKPWQRLILHRGMTQAGEISGKLLDAKGLLSELFEPTCRPSIRWLRTQTQQKTIPCIRIGHLVFFDLDMVRAALAGKNVVRHRVAAPRTRGALRQTVSDPRCLDESTNLDRPA